MLQHVGKQCPRCLGSMFPERDTYGTTFCCLQCGHEIEMQNGVAVAPEPPLLGYAPRRRRRMPWQ
ncbi:hypothetical protein LCGC14_0722950 [marine sediment metagenome]|uniref:Uncharacterized protein n=1 Tax=marine sediment metagenome TaxID=412755 RepID=A0A0F9SX93_9ZZZZ